MWSLNKKIKILYLATFDPTISATGTSIRGKLFLEFFCNHYEVDLIYVKQKDSDGSDESLKKSLSSIKSIDYSSLGYFIFSRKLYQAAYNLLQNKHFDFIFADFEKAGWYAYLLSRKFDIPYIYNSHNVEFLRYLDFAKKNPLRYAFVPYMYFLEKKACKNSLFTIAISEKDAKSFKKWISNEKIIVTPCTFDEKTFNPFYEQIKTENPVVLMVGNYGNPGNRDGAYLIKERIIPNVIKKLPNVIFRCIGKNFPSDICHPNIEVMGFVDDLMSEYQKATIVIVPITIGGGIKIKTIEGLACGKFVISTPKGVEGIDTSDLENVKVIPIEQFSDCIINVISKKISKTNANWEKIKRGYGISYQLSQINEKINYVLSDRNHS